jgi:hypothetical protein
MASRFGGLNTAIFGCIGKLQTDAKERKYPNGLIAPPL